MAYFKKISATFEIVTPMFLGGADQSVSRIRESSIKGALAFWWRALTYSRYIADNKSDLNLALQAMQADEQILFGSTKGQGAFLLKVAPASFGSDSVLKSPGYLRDKQGRVVGPGARYLGYGLMGSFGNTAGQLTRDCLLSGLSFTVDIIIRPLPENHPDPKMKAEYLRGKKRVDEQLVPDLIQAVKVFGLLGGLGSRTRRGWGSVALQKLETFGLPGSWSTAKTREAYQNDIKETLALFPPARETPGKDFKLTAFAKESEINLGSEHSPNGMDVLNAVGEAMQIYRAWGHTRNGTPTVNGRPSEMNFKDDHDWSKGKPPKGFNVPLRAAFGLPQNYKDNAGVKGFQDSKNKDRGIDRRASPLLVHVHKTGDGKFFPVLSLFPNLFLPTNEVSADNKNVAYDFTKDGLKVLRHLLSQEEPKPGSAKPFSNGPYLKLDKVDWTAAK